MLLFTAALNNQIASDSDPSTAAKKSGSKRAIDWDLNTPGFRYPPLKKVALHDDELEALCVASSTSKHSIFR